MANTNVQDVFRHDIYRDIREVVQVDQTDEDVIRSEIGEYVVTDTIQESITKILEAYAESRNHPSERMAVWVSGFFGSGKSSFAKILGLALANRSYGTDSTGALVSEKVGDAKVGVLLNTIAEEIPSDSIVFDVATHRGVRHGHSTLTEIMYRQLLEHFGYAGDLDLADLEMNLEGERRLDRFKATYKQLYPEKDWDTAKRQVVLALNEASRVMHELAPSTYPSPDTWVHSAQGRADVSPNHLADRCKELSARRGEHRNLVFVVDEVGQFVARSANRMLDLQGIVQALGRVGRGKFWLVVTSQEKLNELVGGLDDTRVDLARLMDRFPLQVHLPPNDISEVTRKRVLAKTAEAQSALAELYDAHRGSLTAHTTLSADVALPQVGREEFIALYPMMPYQVDLMIHVVAGLRTQGGARPLAGGANRTVIKLAQQLLAHSRGGLGRCELGRLVTAEHIFDLVQENIDRAIRDKIDGLGCDVDHPLAPAVAKTICLLEFFQPVHRNAENIAAMLYPAIGAHSVKPRVDQALQALLASHTIRRGGDGYRIPTSAEDEWETQRAALRPKQAEVYDLRYETMASLWYPQPRLRLLNTRVFHGGLRLDGRERVRGDIPFHVRLADGRDDYQRLCGEARRRSQAERESIFWVIRGDERIDREATEVFRSQAMIARKERGVHTAVEARLLAEEARRRDSHRAEMRRRLQQAAITSAVYFRGSDRSPEDPATCVRNTAEAIMGRVLPDVFERFAEGAASVTTKDIETLVDCDDLRALPSVCRGLKLLRNEGGTPVFHTDSGALGEVLAWIRNRSDYGMPLHGKDLDGQFGTAPYGWDSGVVKLLALCLLRAGLVSVTSKGQRIESVRDAGAKEVFTHDSLFRTAAFRPQKTLDFADIVNAAEAYKNTFGEPTKSLHQEEVAAAIRDQVAERQKELHEVYHMLDKHHLPGSDRFAEAIGDLERISTARDEETILRFVGGHGELKTFLTRAADIRRSIAKPQLQILARARRVLSHRWPFLSAEADTKDEDRQAAEHLEDLMRRETFFRELPRIDRYATRLERQYAVAFDQAVDSRAETYAAAVLQLVATPGWEQLDEEHRQRIAQPLARRATRKAAGAPSIAQLRAERDACDTYLNRAIAEVHRHLEGDRIVPVSARRHFAGGVDTEEQLDAALQRLRNECLEHIGKHRRVLIQ